LADYSITVFNSETEICVVGSFFSSMAAKLNSVVQPISFLMKINSGTTKFSNSEEYLSSDVSVAQLEYFVVGCPGIDEEYDLEWAQQAMRDFFPWLEYLIEYGFLPGEEELLKLNEPLKNDPTYCDSTVENDIEVDLNGEGYALVSLTTRTFKSTSCFQIFAYAMAAAPEICYIERVVPTDTYNEDTKWISQSNRYCDFPFFDSGLTGKNQIVSLSDSGLDLESCYFKDSDDINYKNVDLSRRKIVSYFDFVDERDNTHGHGTHVAGTIAGHKSVDGINDLDGYGNGVAPDAKLAFFDLGRTGKKGLKVPSDISWLLNFGNKIGAKIHSASWGSNENKYSVREQMIDNYLENDDSFLMIVAAGNEGRSGLGTIGSPAKAKNVLTVGATKLTGMVQEIATFSSRGPTMDGRIKPDVVAYGTNVLSAGAEDGFSCESNAKKPSRDDKIKGLNYKSGTSMATPVVSGNAALIRQYFEEGWQGDGKKRLCSSDGH